MNISDSSKHQTESINEDIFQIITDVSEEQREQVYNLIKEFDDDIEERNNVSNLPMKVQKENIFKRLFMKIKENINIHKKHMSNQKMAEDILKGKRKDSKLFMLSKNGEIIGFEMAQVSNESNERIVGWKPWMYIKKEYRNTYRNFIDKNGKIEKKNVTKELDDTVEKWFSENGVNYQKTSTGINMKENLNLYVSLGFEPVGVGGKNGDIVFLEKDMKSPISGEERKIIKRAIKDGKIAEICNRKKNPFKDGLKVGVELLKKSRTRNENVVRNERNHVNRSYGKGEK